MAEIHPYSLSNAIVDATLREVIHVYEHAFPNQIVAYYVEGSYADQTNLPTSDIDLVIIFRNHLTDDELHYSGQLWEAQSRSSTQEVDITAIPLRPLGSTTTSSR